VRIPICRPSGFASAFVMTGSNALSPLDAAFLHVESDRTPMHMASVAIFEAGPLQDATGGLRIGDIRRLIESRLGLVPKLRQRPQLGLFDQAPPVWLDDPDFDISRHVRVRSCPGRGTERDLRCLSGQILAEPLDPDRPLWGLIFINGLSGQRVAVIEKLHHSMADGIAAAELATVLLDLSADPPKVGAPRQWNPASPQSFSRGAVRDLLRLGELTFQVARWGGRTFVHPLRQAKEGVRVATALGTLVRPRTFAPRSSLNTEIGPRRSVDFVRLGLEQVRDVAHRNGATINDVLLTIVTGGLHNLLECRGELTAKSQVQALVPVGLGDVEGRGLANKVSAYFVRLPVGDADPITGLSAISERMRWNKDQHQELAAGAVLQLLEPVPQQALAKVVGLVQHQPFFNLIVTNVPGPPVPLYALGAKLLEIFPIVPLAGNQSLGVAAMSYEGQLNLGVFADPDACPDVDAFCDAARSTLQVLFEHSAVSP
jgi:diacylglycerol O-acyltransferase